METITKETRRESYLTILTSLSKRHKAVLKVLKECGDMTAQEVASELYKQEITPTDERNFSAPRLTELLDKGLVTTVGKKICKKSGRSVSIWSVTMNHKNHGK